MKNSAERIDKVQLLQTFSKLKWYWIGYTLKKPNLVEKDPLD